MGRIDKALSKKVSNEKRSTISILLQHSPAFSHKDSREEEINTRTEQQYRGNVDMPGKNQPSQANYPTNKKLITIQEQKEQSWLCDFLF